MSVELIPPPAIRRFRPNSWAQQRCGVSDTLELLYSGRLGSSKTRTLDEKADTRCLEWPGARVAVTRRYRTDLHSTIKMLLEDIITPAEKAWGWQVSADGGSTLFYPNGSEILFSGLDRATKLRSAEFDLILVEQAEEADEEMWQELGGRLRHVHGPYQQLGGFCNPDSPGHFLYQRFGLKHGSHIQHTTKAIELPTGQTLPAGYPLREAIFAGTRDNLENLDLRYHIILASLTGVQRQRLLEGKWVLPIGVVYPEFNPARHIVGTPKLWQRWGGYPPPDWERICGIDLGYTDPFVCTWFAISPDDVMVAYREIYMSHRTIPVHGRQIVNLEARELATLRQRGKDMGRSDLEDYLEGLYVTARYCDHGRGEREQLDEIFQEAGSVPTSPADKNLSGGIESVRSRLAHLPHPRLYYLRDMLVEEDEILAAQKKPTSTFDEYLRYRYPKHRPTASNTETSLRRFDLPVDRDNHGMDDGRYAVHTHDHAPKVGVY